MKTYLFSLILLLFTSTAMAQNKVVVVPLFSSAVPIENIVTVGLDNADFTSPAAAVNSITDATFLRPYLVFIGPGTYTIQPNQLIVQPNIHLVGSGVGATILRGFFGNSSASSSAVVRLEGNSAGGSVLRDLTINQFGSATAISSGVYTEGFSTIDNVEINVRSNGVSNFGVFSETATLEISNSAINIQNASFQNVGIRAIDGTHNYNNLEIDVAGSIFTAAIQTDDAEIALDRVNATSRSATNTNALWGLFIRDSSVDVNFSQFDVENNSPGSLTSFGGCFTSGSGGVVYYSTLEEGCTVDPLNNGLLLCAFAKGSFFTELEAANCLNP